MVYTCLLSQSRCGTCKDVLNMCIQIILTVNWLQCSGSDRKVCTALIASLGRENYPTIPNPSLQDRSFAARGRGAVSLGPCTPGIRAPLTGSPACVCWWPGSEGKSSQDRQRVQVWVIPGVSWAGGEEEKAWPTMLFLNAGFLLNVCFQQASGRFSSPEVWNALSMEIYVSLPKRGAFLLGRQHCMTQAITATQCNSRWV